MNAYRQVKTFITSFTIGGLIGGLFGLLLAPKSGIETREMIRNKSNELRDMVGENVEGTRNQMERTFEDITRQTKKKATKLKKVGEKMLNEQKHSIGKGVEDAQKVIQS